MVSKHLAYLQEIGRDYTFVGVSHAGRDQHAWIAWAGHLVPLFVDIPSHYLCAANCSKG